MFGVGVNKLTTISMSLETKDNRDYSLIACPKCGVTKKRIRDGKRPESKETRFVDERGLEFSGRVCPDCHRNKVKQTKQLNSKLIKQAKELNGKA